MSPSSTAAKGQITETGILVGWPGWLRRRHWRVFLAGGDATDFRGLPIFIATPVMLLQC